MKAIAAYKYGENGTQVYDAYWNCTAHVCNENKQLIGIHTFQDEDLLYRVERFHWQKERLKSRSVENCKGHVAVCQTFYYDEAGNVTEERLWGNLTGDCTVHLKLDEEGRPKKNGIEYCATRYSYSDDGRNLMLSKEEPNGRVTRYQYLPDSDRVVSEEIFDGNRLCKRTRFEYNSGKALVRKIEDDGHTVRTDVRMTQPSDRPYLGQPEWIEDGRKRVHITYNLQGLATRQEIYDLEGRLLTCTSTQYDEAGQIIAETDALGYVTEYRYDDNGNRVYKRTSDLEEIATYDRANRLVRLEHRSREGSRTRTFEYDLKSQCIASSDWGGNVTHYRYNPFGRCNAIAYPQVLAGTNQAVHPVAQRGYDLFGRVTAEQNSAGEITVIAYNARGQPIKITYADDTYEHHHYTIDGQLRSTERRDGSVVSYEYDLFGRPIRIEERGSDGTVRVRTATADAFNILSMTDGDGITTHYTYSPDGLLVRQDKGGASTRTDYDALSRPIRVEEWDGDRLIKVHCMTYDPAGRVIQDWEEDAKGAILMQVQMVYDHAGRCIERREGEAITRTEYAADGTPVCVTDALGRTTRTHLDPCALNDRGQRVTQKRITDADGYVRIITCDAMGREERIEELDPHGALIRTTEQRFDGANRRMRLNNGETSQQWKYQKGHLIEWNDGSRRHQYRYELGRLVEEIKPDGTRLLTDYDGLGRVRQIRGGNDTYVLTHSPEDRLLSIQCPEGMIQCTYDSQGYLSCETLPSGYGLRYSRDSWGRVLQMFLPDSSSIDYDYQGGRLTELSRPGYRCWYAAFNPSGRPETLAYSNGAQVQWKYDLLCRHIECCYPDDHNLSIGYGQRGQVEQRQWAQDDSQTYAYDGLGRLIDPQPDRGRVYDLNGNCIRSGLWSYQYDAWDRLVRATCADGRIVQYTYDHAHRCLSRRTPQETTYFLWDGQNEIGSCDQMGAMTELRLLGHGLGAEIGASVAIELSDGWYIPVHDQRGELLGLIDGATMDTAMWRRTTPYGAVQQASGIRCPWTFASKREDPDTHLIYFARRYYDPSAGLWLTPDPRQPLDGSLPYLYANGDPLGQIDLYGLWSMEPIWSGLGAIAYGVGRTLEFVGHHLIPFPAIREGIEYIGRGLSGRILPEGKTQRMMNEPGVYHEGTYREGQAENIAWVTGICTNLDEARASAKQFSKERLNGAEIGIIYPGSNGFILDVLQAVANYLCLQTDGLSAMIRGLNEVYSASNGRDLHIIAHSWGALLTVRALQCAGPQMKEHIAVTTCGSPLLMEPNEAASVRNFAGEGDWVVKLLNMPAELFTGRGRRAEIIWVPGSDHSLMGNSYWPVIASEVNDQSISHSQAR